MTPSRREPRFASRERLVRISTCDKMAYSTARNLREESCCSSRRVHRSATRAAMSSAISVRTAVRRSGRSARAVFGISADVGLVPRRGLRAEDEDELVLRAGADIDPGDPLLVGIASHRARALDALGCGGQALRDTGVLAEVVVVGA